MSLTSHLDSISEFALFLRAKYLVGFDCPSGPLLDPDGKRWFEAEIKRTKFYLEFGCGGTTLLADRLGVPTISVESDPTYASVVRNALGQASSTQILTPPMGLTGPWGRPIFAAAKKGHIYISAPFRSISSQFPDLIVVDGRYRVACALNCANEAAKRGASARLLFDDYSLRKHYHKVEQYLGPPHWAGRAAIFHLGKAHVAEEIIDEIAADPN